MWAQVSAASGLAFLFVPINLAAYASLPPEKSNDASAMMNLARNNGRKRRHLARQHASLAARPAVSPSVSYGGHVTPLQSDAQRRCCTGMMSARVSGPRRIVHFPTPLLQSQRMVYRTVQRQGADAGLH